MNDKQYHQHQLLRRRSMLFKTGLIYIYIYIYNIGDMM